MHVPELHEAFEKHRPGAAAELHRLAISVGADDKAVDAAERQLLRRVAGRRPFGTVAVGNLAHPRDRSAADDVDAVLRRPCRALRHGHRVPQRRMRQLRRLQVDRHLLVVIVLAGKVDLVPGQRLHDDAVSLDIHRLRLVGIDAEIIQLVRRGAATDTDFDAAEAEMIQHADFFREPQRMMRREHIDQRAETDAARALGDGGQEHAGRRREIERRRVMLAHVPGTKAGAVVEFDQREPLLVLL